MYTPLKSLIDIYISLLFGRRKTAYRVSLASFMAFGGIFLILGATNDLFLFEKDLRQMMFIIGAFCSSLSIMMFILIYLQSGFTKQSTRNDDGDDEIIYHLKRRLAEVDSIDESRLKPIQDSVSKLKIELNNIRSTKDQLTEQQKEVLYDSLRNRIIEEQSQELLTKIETSIFDKVVKDTKADAILKQSTNTLYRLTNEISSLSRRGNLNLTLGVSTTIAGLAVLTYYVIKLPPEMNEPWAFGCHFIPRLTLVAFIEIFAYFFLKLYKECLSEIKYFQNELTNVEARFAALYTAVLSDYDDAAKNAIDSLTKTERNSVLHKDETTVEIEKAKIAKQDYSEIVRELVSIIKIK